MNKATIEVAVFADAMQRAARIAPTKGPALDRAAGIVIDLNPHPDERLVVMATNLEVTYRQRVPAIEVTEGLTPTRWRVPAALVAGIAGQLSPGQVTLLDRGDGFLYITSGTTKVKLRQFTGGYPLLERFEADELSVVDGLGARLAQVAWAAAKKGQTVFRGVHMDGERLWATDKYVLATVPCKVPVDHPTTALLSEVADLMKDAAELRMGVADNRLRLMTNDETQATAVVIVEDYPKVDALMAKAAGKNNRQLKVSRDELATILNRMLVVARSDRNVPRLRLTTNATSLLLAMDVEEVGAIREELAVEHVTRPEDEFTWECSPLPMQSVLNASRRAEVVLSYGPSPLSHFRLDDDDDYRTLISPLHDPAAKAAA